MTFKIATLAAAVMAVGLFSGSAMAIPPPTIVGTWIAMGNQTPLTIFIKSQKPSVSGRCPAISGTIVDGVSGLKSNLVGFYCPATGRFNFVRNDLTSGVTIADFSGNVSDDIGSHLFMGGVAAQVIHPAFIGEYNFCASM